MANNLFTLKQDNPNYWTLCVSRSQYSEDEILSTLDEIKSVNAEWNNFVNNIWSNVLTDEDGPMGLIEGYASDAHRTVAIALAEAYGSISPSFSQNSHSNCFPVKTWQKDIKRCKREMKSISKLVDAC